jgi:large subunit ribosomal protein L21
MYAIVEIAGQQFKVEKGNKLFVQKLDNEKGSEVKFDKVLLVDNNDKITVGTPIVEKANVSAKVLNHVQGDTVLVFKKKRRKGYQTLNGHRQKYTEIEIQDINA